MFIPSSSQPVATAVEGRRVEIAAWTAFVIGLIVTGLLSARQTGMHGE